MIMTIKQFINVDVFVITVNVKNGCLYLSNVLPFAHRLALAAWPLRIYLKSYIKTLPLQEVAYLKKKNHSSQEGKPS